MRNFISKLFLIIGILIILYPFLSNLIITIDQMSLIMEYESNVKKMTEKEIERAKEEAKKYNEELTTDIVKEPEKEGNGTNYYSALNLGDVIGYVDVPKVDIYLPIYHGTSYNVLQKGVGHVENTSLPVGGLGTHCVLSGHSGLAKSKMFDNIRQLEIGDLFYLRVLDETLTYKVDQISVVLPSEIEEVLIEADKDYVTLVTCTPIVINSHRLLVRGERIENIENPEEVAEKPEENEEIISQVPSDIEAVRYNIKKQVIEGIIALIVIIILIIILILILFRIRKIRAERKLKNERNTSVK